jgi:hypothetical protein
MTSLGDFLRWKNYGKFLKKTTNFCGLDLFNWNYDLMSGYSEAIKLWKILEKNDKFMLVRSLQLEL